MNLSDALEKAQVFLRTHSSRPALLESAHYRRLFIFDGRADVVVGEQHCNGVFPEG